MTVTGARSQRPPGRAARRDSRSGARPGRRRCTPTAARPTSITCAATISTTAPTSRSSSTTCRSTCRPTRTARATPTSTGSSRKPSTRSKSARDRISPTSATSPPPATCMSTCATASTRTSSESPSAASAICGLSHWARVKVGEGSLLYAGEFNSYDGPWVNPDDMRKFSGLLRYSQGTATDGLSATAMAYSNSWNSTDQIPLRAVTTGQIGLVRRARPDRRRRHQPLFAVGPHGAVRRRRLVESQCVCRQIA